MNTNLVHNKYFCRVDACRCKHQEKPFKHLSANQGMAVISAHLLSEVLK